MEKLQAAIERARQQRQAIQAAAPNSQSVAEIEDERPEADVDDRWERLPEMAVSKRLQRRNRLFIEGKDAQSSHFDKLRTKVLQQCRDNDWKRLVITSATKGCGKTTIACNLAASFARQMDRRVVLLDLDMRRPEMARMLAYSSECGFSDVLDDRQPFEACAVRLGRNVAIGMNQKSHENPAKILLQDRTSEILDEIEAAYQPDLMIFDAPPLLATDDTLAFLKNADCALIVAAAEKTTTEEVDVVEKEVAQQTAVMGVVLNKCIYLDNVHGYYGYE